LAEFATNNYQLEAPDVSLFFANNGCHSYLNFDITKQWNLLENLNVQEYATKLQKVHSLIQAELSFAQAKQQENVDRHHNPTPAYQVGDLV
jgi:hypothetical protein